MAASWRIRHRGTPLKDSLLRLGNYGRRGDSGNASSKRRSRIEKITAPDDSAFMSL